MGKRLLLITPLRGAVVLSNCIVIIMVVRSSMSPSGIGAPQAPLALSKTKIGVRQALNLGQLNLTFQVSVRISRLRCWIPGDWPHHWQAHKRSWRHSRSRHVGSERSPSEFYKAWRENAQVATSLITEPAAPRMAWELATAFLEQKQRSECAGLRHRCHNCSAAACNG